MNTTNCNCEISCTVKAVLASIIIGIVTAALIFTATITITPVFLWVLLGIAVGYLGIEVLTSSVAHPERKSCCRNLTVFFTGILGTILTSLVLLGITFAATSLIGAIITGLLLFFFSLLIISSVCLIKCRYSCNWPFKRCVDLISMHRSFLWNIFRIINPSSFHHKVFLFRQISTSIL